MLCTSGFVDDGVFSRNDPMTRHVAIEHDKHNSRDSGRILLNDGPEINQSINQKKFNVA